MRLFANLLVSTTAVLIATYIVPGSTIDTLADAVVVAVVLGVLNMFLKPILTILTLPITIITLGLFYFVVNTVIVLLVDYLVPGFRLETVLSAFVFSIALSLINTFLSSIARD